MFFWFSYANLRFPLTATSTMGDMPGSTFHASRTERLRRRTDGPALTLVRDTGGVPHPYP